MMPHCKRDSQFELFDHPGHEAERPPKLALPFQRKAEIDPKRVARILFVSNSTVMRLLKKGLIRSLSIPGERRPRIPYEAVVDYCNRLRLEYRISTRSLGKLQGRRYRDDELLPFPWRDTIGMAEAQAALECTKEVVRILIEEGILIAYQVFIGEPGSPWRIQKQSLERYMESLRIAAAPSRHDAPSRL